MISGQGFRRDKLLDRRPYLRLGGITKMVQAVHAIVRQTHAPDPTPPPLRHKIQRICANLMGRSGTRWGCPDPRYLWPAPRLFHPRLF